MKKEKIKVIYNDRDNLLKNDKRFNYCVVDKELYYKMLSIKYNGNISIYFIDKDNKEYGLTIDNINEIKGVE